jgi:hypothetical protein
MLLSAAAVALLIMPGVAQAKIPVLDLGDVCHALMIQIQHAQVNGFSHYTCETGNFVGVVAKIRGSAERSVIASIQMRDQPDSQFLLQVSYPLVDHATWSLYYTSDGYRMTLYQSGTYTVLK